MKPSNFALSIVVILQICCSNSNIESSDSKISNQRKFSNIVNSGGTPSTVDEGSMYYYAYTLNEDSQMTVIYNGNAQFFNNNVLNSSGQEDVGTISFGTINVNTNVANYGDYTYYFNNSNATNSANITQFGNNVTFSISGGGSSSNSSGNVNFYVPEEIYFDTIPHGCPYHPIYFDSLPYTLNWNADPNNSSVVIEIVYNGPKSHQMNSSLSDQSYSYTLLVSDNGTYSLTNSDLAGIPRGAVIEVFLGRGGSDSFSGGGGKTVQVGSYAYTKRLYLFQ